MNPLAKGGGKKTKRLRYCLHLFFWSDEFLHFRTIQGYSGDNIVDPLLQDSVLIPDDFAEYIYHVGNAFEMHSIVKSGLIPGVRSLRRDRQSVFFTAVDPMDTQQHQRDSNTIWTNPESHRTNTNGELTTIQFIGVIKSLLKERDCKSIKLDRMQLLFQAHCQRFV